MADYRSGDTVRVKTATEIAQTLDANGRLDGLPFMPEMLRFCGQVVKVSRSAHKTCDTVNKTGGRSLTQTVHLGDLRCDGAAHGGCQALCLLYWKNAWLEPVSDPATNQDAAVEYDAGASDLEKRLVVSQQRGGRTSYRCQATLLPEFTTLLPWWHVGQYWRDLRSRNVRLGEMLGTFVLQFLRNRMHWPPYRLWVGLHNLLQKPLGNYNVTLGKPGVIPVGKPTPVDDLNLCEGELVEVKPYEEIRQTLNHEGKNRGMRYDIEMQPFSGRQFRVAKRVTRIIDEVTGEMLEMKTPSIILEGGYCPAKFSRLRLFCPRRLPGFYRENWLRRVEEAPVSAVADEFRLS